MLKMQNDLDYKIQSYQSEKQKENNWLKMNCETISKAINTYNFNPNITRLGNNSICINKCGKLRFHER